MAEVGDGNQQEIADTRLNVPLLLGRLAGAVVVIAALAFGIWLAREIVDTSDSFGIGTPLAAWGHFWD